MMIGLAIKLCISLGLHRKSPTRRLGLPAELDKRLFWTCYYLDRDVTIGSGRPPSISDHDIDVEVGNDLHHLRAMPLTHIVSYLSMSMNPVAVRKTFVPLSILPPIHWHARLQLSPSSFIR
jgi:hypothetical protein